MEIKHANSIQQIKSEATKNEIEFSKLNSSNYYLYRLFDFDTNINVGKFYQIKGDLYKELELEAILYLAIPK